jgi:hypothetical protein
MTLRLVPLDCPTCGSAMRGESCDVMFFCGHCGAAAVIGEDGVEPVVSLALMPAAGRSAQVWRPAWVLETGIEIRDRITAGGGSPSGWSGDRRFIIPAFNLALADLVRLSRALAEAPEDIGEVPREPITGGTLSLEDAVTVVRHIVVGDEARRPDALSSLTAVVEMRSHRLAALPFEVSGTRLTCAITGVSVELPTA